MGGFKSLNHVSIDIDWSTGQEFRREFTNPFSLVEMLDSKLILVKGNVKHTIINGGQKSFETPNGFSQLL